MGRIQAKLARVFMAINIWLYRRSRGRIMGRLGGVPVLLLTATGRKTGQPRTTPLGYVRDGERYLLAGSNGGQPAEPQWFRNLRATDHADIEVGDQRISVHVAVAGPDEYPALWTTFTTAAPGFKAYQAKAGREIPVAILTPEQHPAGS